jgi:hypothetical protein
MVLSFFVSFGWLFTRSKGKAEPALQKSLPPSVASDINGVDRRRRPPYCGRPFPLPCSGGL